MIEQFRIRSSRFSGIILFVYLFLAASAWGAAPPLYAQWHNLVKPTGVHEVQWLPRGQGYLETKTGPTSGTVTFFKVDPRSGAKAELFDAALKQSLLAQYAALTGKPATRLPFKSFRTTEDGEGILFSDPLQNNFYYSFKTLKLLWLRIPGTASSPRAARAAASSSATLREFPDRRQSSAFSPDYTRYAFVKGYDLYLHDLATSKTQHLTSGGSETLRNGIIDWVYDEELEDRHGKALWWSPDGSQLAFMQFDESKVARQPIAHDLGSTRAAAFPSSLELQRYPKAGGVNPTVKLFIIRLETGQKVEIQTASSPEVYFTRVAWSPDSKTLFFQRLSRAQNELELMAADPQTGAARRILLEREPTYINLHDDFRPLKDGRRFTWSSERSGIRQLYLYDLEGRQLCQLTSGTGEAGPIVKVDEPAGRVYFYQAENYGMDTRLASVGLDGTGLKCLTPARGVHQASLDPEGEYFFDKFSSLDAAPTASLYKADGTLLRQTGGSDDNRANALGLLRPELLKLKAADGKTDTFGLLFKPAGFDPNKKYPLLVSVYGGPTKMNFNSYQTTSTRARLAQLGFLVFELDGRGTTRRGKSFLAATWRKFGQIEVDDQAAAVRQLSRRPCVDARRVGIMGASYGGYLTCMALLRYPEVFQVGVAASAVTDWRSYDTIYTERYMGTPASNPEGYRKGSALTYAKNLKGKLLLTHGTIDDNVHQANMIHLIDALQREGKDFDVMLFPENRHGIAGYNRQYAQKKRLDYFLQHLRPAGWEASRRMVWASSEKD